MIRCILFGNMCSGKTTVGRLLAQGRPYAIVSAKDAVARNLAGATDEVKGLRSKGYLLPDPVISGWVLGAVAAEVARGHQVIVDGFPRTEVQARLLIEAQGAGSDVVFCDFPLPVLEQRFSTRVLCSACDMPTNRAFEDFEGRCTVCGGTAFAPRETDRPDYMAVKTRQYESESTRVLPVLRAAGLKFHTVRDHPRLAELRTEVEALAPRLGAAHGH